VTALSLLLFLQLAEKEVSDLLSVYAPPVVKVGAGGNHMVGLGSNKDRWCIGYAHMHMHMHTKPYRRTTTTVIIVAFHKDFPP
jgi:hypothetical protein